MVNVLHRVLEAIPVGGRKRQVVAYAVILPACAIAVVSCGSAGRSAAPHLLELKGDLRVHDPAIQREGERYYVFSTVGRRRGGVFFRSAARRI